MRLFGNTIVEKKPQYTFDENQWRTYDIQQLDEAEAKVVTDRTAREANWERFVTVFAVAGFTASLFVTGFAAIAVAGVVHKLGVIVLTKIAVLAATKFPPLAYAATRFVLSLTMVGITLVALKKLWVKGTKSIENHWNYAKHLDQQSFDADVRRAKLAGPFKKD